MPDYLIKIGNDENRSIRKVSIFSSSVDDAEKQIPDLLNDGEHVVSISNNSFPIGHIKAVRNPY